MKEGKVIIVSAPSGSGKSTLVNHLLSSDPGLEFSVSATTRSPRGTEKNGVDYFFLSVPEFRSRIEKGEFAEWEEVYNGQYYGTLKSELERIWAAGKTILFDVDVKGGISLKKIFGDRGLSIFIMPPSVEVLRQRLIARGTDSPEKIDERVKKAGIEIESAGLFDLVIVNDNLETAKNEILKAVKDFTGR